MSLASGQHTGSSAGGGDAAAILASAAAVYIVCCLLCEWLTVRLPNCVLLRRRLPPERFAAVAWSVLNLTFGSATLHYCRQRWRSSLETPDFVLIAEAVKLFAMLFVADSAFYWSHRWLHWPRVFRAAHRMHHEHVAPVPWTALYVHPIEFATALLGIFVAPTSLFATHWTTYTLFLWLVMFSLVFSHSGLHLDSKLSASHHEKHHRLLNVNFGSDVGPWDALCGTRG